jgi:spermidine synthase
MGSSVEARGPMAHIFDGRLTDPRVALHEAEVGDLINSARSAFDAILLDVDNGPGGLNREANERLYSARGLNAARRALRPGRGLPLARHRKAALRRGGGADGQSGARV